VSEAGGEEECRDNQFNKVEKINDMSGVEKGEDENKEISDQT